MIKQAYRSMEIVWGSAKLPAICKVIQSIATALLTPLILYLLQQLISNVEGYLYSSNFLSAVFIYLVCLITAIFLTSNMGYADNRLKISIQRRLNETIGTQIVGKLLRMDYGCFENKEFADIWKRMGTEPQTKILEIFYDTLKMAALLVSILGTAVIFSQVSVWFSAFFLIALISMVYMDYRAMNIMNALFREQSEAERRLEDLNGLLESKHTLLELKIFMAVDYILSKWRKLNKQVLDERIRKTIHSQKYYAISTLLFLIWASFLIVTLTKAVSEGSIDMGLFVALIGSISTILELSQSFSRTLSSASKKFMDLQYFDAFMNLPEEERREYSGDIDYRNIHIVFDKVCFTYPGTRKKILDNFSMEIFPGQNVAIVGENGAGKSTVIKLLCRLYRPDSGTITINSINIELLSREQIKKALSTVFQNYACYELTLRENVAFGDICRLDNDQELQRAMKEGLAQPILKKLAGGLDSYLGKLETEGVDLSGGEWQRVALARACLKDSGLIVLDEPTAALDPIAESELYEAFASMLKNRSCIMISHRLGSAKMADWIYVMEKGRSAESGTHSELIIKKGLYERMYRLQAGWYQASPKEGEPSL